MNDKQRAWIEKNDENICNVLQDMSPEESHKVEAMFWCGLVDWDTGDKRLNKPNRLEILSKALKEYGKTESLIQSMRDAYRTWVLDARKAVVNDNGSGTIAR